MTDSEKDMWIQWLLNRRFGGDSGQMKRMLSHLYPIRDKVLSLVSLERKTSFRRRIFGGGKIEASI